ncbi:MAG: alpha/beta hydrolase [Myxococcota bacterium]|nr:alpha/beta hydrolase [Myxococcota bacterium]
MEDVLVLAHGAFHGPWCWQPTLRPLEAAGVRCIAVDLDRGGLEADRAALQGVVDDLVDENCRVHAIGHSLGCSSVARLDPRTLATLTLLAGSAVGPGMPDPAGITFAGFGETLIAQSDGRTFLSREDARAIFYHRCSEKTTEAALDRLRPTFVYGGEETSPPIWDAIPVTYIECLDDRVVQPAFQRATAAQCPYSAALDSDHSPMLGQPEALASLVLEAMGRAN